MMEGMQPSLFEIKPFSNRNNAVAFGITKTGLNKGKIDALENIFYGMHNLKIPLEMLSIENPAEILSEYFAAGSLKRGNRHLTLGIPHGFLELVNYINRYSYNNKGFASLAHNFKKCFNNSPGKQRKRLELLEQSVGDIFVGMFFTKYRFSNKEDPFTFAFYDPNCDGASKGVYIDIIYKELKSSSDRLKN